MLLRPNVCLCLRVLACAGGFLGVLACCLRVLAIWGLPFALYLESFCSLWPSKMRSRELENDVHYYQSCLEAILQSSPKAKIFCLIHKMDLVEEDQRDLIFNERCEHIKKLSKPLDCHCFRTSIWDETLYIPLISL